MKPKVLAFYLPQFYKVQENDEWWGEGFTDWVSTKNAKPLFEKHYQPHIPLNENYYNLMDKHIMEWQAELMHRYDVDGVCMYHYWFRDGRQILEKPAENLLKSTNIDMPFCFCWANETWARSWSNINGSNVWSNVQEPNRKIGDKAILLEQTYGEKEQWKQHFEYLLPFFRDERYIKLEGKPLFLIYKTNLIPCLGEMLTYWRELAEDNGLSGIYVIGSNCTVNEYVSVDAELIQEPQNTIMQLRNVKERIEGVERYDYHSVWEQALYAQRKEIKTYFGGFVGYDDTPRRGQEGTVIQNQDAHAFENYLSQLIVKNQNAGNELIFINAWNEWGEGMYLEPDQKNGDSFLRAIKEAKKNYQKMKLISANGEENIEVKNLRNLCAKYEWNMNVFDAWMRLKENGGSLVQYFEKHNYKKIALYGYGMLGKHFIKEIENTNVSLEYIIDQQGKRLKSDIQIFSMNGDLEEVDVVVVSIRQGAEKVKRELHRKGFKQVVALDEIILETE